ncbi:hypothetical protein SASPL_117922 [Salvia splendens]|uniref:Uncharacterized protein n=1 Tax=Salvia splendens TaxID=180675 RepID=A0A8X8XVU8_SALSN|nr:hypothetical protein SASPL_117922 [Salvia splendens]
MDVDDEWELISDEDYLEISDEAVQPIYSVVHMNYFISQPSPQFVETTTNQLLHAPDHDQPIRSKIESFSADQDPISQDFFNKLKEAESVHMKVESPKYEAGEDPRKLNSEMASRMTTPKRSLSGLCSQRLSASTIMNRTLNLREMASLMVELDARDERIQVLERIVEKLESEDLAE